MSGLKYFQRTQYVQELITKRKTGSPAVLAKRINVSERTIYRIVNDLKLLHEPKYTIEFSVEEGSYILRKLND